MKGTSPQITNIVSCYSLPFDIDLKNLVTHYPKVDYRPGRFNGAIVKRKANCLLIFRNGKVNVVGNKNIDDANEGIVELCKNLGRTCKIQGRIVNIVATCGLGYPVILNEIVNSTNGVFEYNPEIYPAAYYRIGKSRISVFHTGKLVFTGFTSVTDLYDAFDEISLLIKFCS